ncbi:MAG TPA: DinB family protein [Thermoanaerobaculia bacterium]|nr:DinB family protein [Thermoanaerobaculia bacterium]
MPDLPAAALEALRTRTTRVFPEQIRSCVAPLTDEQIWWRPNESSNSIGNLLLHLTGSLNHYLNRGVGGFDYQRDRPAEFSERRPIPKEQLLAAFEAMVTKAEQTFAALTPERLSDPSPEPNLHSLLFEDLFAVAVHLSNHTGQIVWIAKMLHEGGAGEIWIRTHREAGARKRSG